MQVFATDGYTEDNDFAAVLVLRTPRNPLLEIREAGPLSSRFTLPESAVELVTRDSVAESIRKEIEDSVAEDARRQDRESILSDLLTALEDLTIPDRHLPAVRKMIEGTFDLLSP